MGEVKLTMEEEINKTGELLFKYEQQNRVLKEKGKFNMQQANFTMKRFAEELASYFLKQMKASNTESANKSQHPDVKQKIYSPSQGDGGTKASLDSDRKINAASEETGEPSAGPSVDINNARIIKQLQGVIEQDKKSGINSYTSNAKEANK